MTPPGQDPPPRHHVIVSGYTYSATAATNRGSTIEVYVQERRPGLPDELAWITVPGVTTPDDTGEDTSLLWRGWVDVPTGPGRGPLSSPRVVASL